QRGMACVAAGGVSCSASPDARSARQSRGRAALLTVWFWLTGVSCDRTAVAGPWSGLVPGGAGAGSGSDGGRAHRRAVAAGHRGAGRGQSGIIRRPGPRVVSAPAGTVGSGLVEGNHHAGG